MTRPEVTAGPRARSFSPPKVGAEKGACGFADLSGAWAAVAGIRSNRDSRAARRIGVGMASLSANGVRVSVGRDYMQAAPRRQVRSRGAGVLLSSEPGG